MTMVQAVRRESSWNECDSHARHLNGDGKEVVVTCDMDRHAAPGEANVVHHDPTLGIWWTYDDNEPRFDDEEREPE